MHRVSENISVITGTNNNVTLAMYSKIKILPGDEKLITFRFLTIGTCQVEHYQQ